MYTKFAVPALLLVAGFASAQSPRTTETASVGEKKISIVYGSPAVRGRRIFGEGGLLSSDPTYPVWRAGANAATSFHTDADLDVGGLAVPKGNYTLYVDVKDPDAWVFVISKGTGQWGLTYPAGMDLGRVKMTMSTAPAVIENLKYTLAIGNGNKGTLQLSWDRHIASVPIMVK